MLRGFIKVAVGLSILRTSVLATPLYRNGTAFESDKHGAVACESAVCTSIGIDILEKGGNAADALVATQLCVGVVAMYHSGYVLPGKMTWLSITDNKISIGGGGFMLVRSANGSYEFIDFRETAGEAAFETMYNNDTNLSLYGGLASGVPGELRGLEHLYRNYGSLPWKTLVTPAVNLARYGFNVTADLVRYMASGTSSSNFLVEDETWAIDFAPNGTLVQLGDIMTRKRYANTLESIADYGVDVFYHGALANATVTALQADRGTLTLKDLANYSVAIREPSYIEYRGFKIRSGSAPSSGAVVLSTLKTVEGYDMSTPSDLNMSTFYLNEAMRFAYGERTLLGDASFLHNMTEYQAEMLSEANAEDVRSQIESAHTLNISSYDPSNLAILSDSGTSASVTADSSGLTIAVTSTVNTYFGSHVMVPETGVIMNNEMNDFSIPGTSNAFGYVPSSANYIKPGKRPLSSISPTIVEYPDGSVYISHASAGGSRIITEVIQHLWHVIDQGMTSAEALASPRLHDQLSPNVCSFEYGNDQVKGYSNETTAFLASKGVNVTFIAPGQTTAQGIRRFPNGTFEAASEPRQLNSGAAVI